MSTAVSARKQRVPQYAGTVGHFSTSGYRSARKGAVVSDCWGDDGEG
jgi:hypothetical protein